MYVCTGVSVLGVTEDLTVMPNDQKDAAEDGAADGGSVFTSDVIVAVGGKVVGTLEGLVDELKVPQ